ncbi:uncharacterized protein MYCFIDRAFT_197220 [Pseudocercospora fijiensis CIRAD86]|uniref:Uncharacterized protein n=1 Tax=Pseudocercospora fijiensis (strain CIRAD86) TaxID=383855 RepID=M2YW57_PSEFD|nr:uncharacterized protein MYCFIDRAFT_197220 [Pseudocercospora fijiensis CIRAD86]EME81955.1 hypothetical protein MYCFIDRAFT_197220 [Pseudocercospora fijiensis CIRAD86]
MANKQLLNVANSRPRSLRASGFEGDIGANEVSRRALLSSASSVSFARRYIASRMATLYRPHPLLSLVGTLATDRSAQHIDEIQCEFLLILQEWIANVTLLGPKQKLWRRTHKACLEILHPRVDLF